MSVLDRLAGALGRSDERPNVALAEALVGSGDVAAIEQLVDVLRGDGPKPQKNDALKVLYEVGRRRPALVSPYGDVFLALLQSHTSRQVWGAMQALETIAGERPETLMAELPAILEAADRGTVIAKDCCTGLLVKLAAAGHADKVVPILVERLAEAAPNQFPAYAEETATVVTETARPGFLRLLKSRLTAISQRAKRQRVEKLLRRMGG